MICDQVTEEKLPLCELECKTPVLRHLILRLTNGNAYVLRQHDSLYILKG